MLKRLSINYSNTQYLLTLHILLHTLWFLYMNLSSMLGIGELARIFLPKVKKTLTRAQEYKYLSEYRSYWDNKPLKWSTLRGK